MSTQASQLILTQTDLPDRDLIARILVAYVFDAPAESDSAEPEAIIMRGAKPGEDATIVSRNLRNVIVNWRELVTDGVPALVGTIASFAAHPAFGVFAALKAVRVWTGLLEVKLSERHAAVVRALWIDCPEDKLMTIDELRRVLDGHAGDEIGLLLNDLAILGLVDFDEHDRIVRRDRLILK